MSVVEVQQQETNGNGSNNACVLPQLRGQSQKMSGRGENDFLPQELMIALRQSNLPAEYLGPANSNVQTRTLRPIPPSSSRRPDNAWNFPRQRERYRYLLEQNPCTCGAGHDISFLCEANTNFNQETSQKSMIRQNRTTDKSAIRATTNEMKTEPTVVLPESIIPQEFRLVKNIGVTPIEVFDQKHTTITEDHLNHVTVFPSLKPVGRSEVLKLRHTMDALLERITIADNDLKGQTQIHNLLDLVKEEQNIYNIVFHEIIRQVTVECKERGELLSKLRERYASLLSRIPRQLKSLYDELVAQRTLDRRLAEELTQFKSTVGSLMLELEDVREHDRRVTEEAEKAQRDLKSALAESQKNASLLTEYHELYDLQRKRLEKQVSVISSEKELWREAAHTIALKVINEYHLATSKRLSLAEQSWYALATHFAIYLTDKDTIDLTEIQRSANHWREIIENFDNEQEQREFESKKNLQRLIKSVESFRTNFRLNHFDGEGKLVQTPDPRRAVEYLTFTKSCEDACTREIEKFGGDTVLINEDRLRKADRHLRNWIEMSEKLLSRHPSTSSADSSDQKMFTDTFQMIYLLHGQFRVRMTGENGFAQMIIFFSNVIESWTSKINTFVYNNGKFSEAEWGSFFNQSEEWIETLTRASDHIGKPTKEIDDQITEAQRNNQEKPSVRTIDVLQQANKSLVGLRHYIESHNGRTSDETLDLDAKMVHWLIEVLIGLAPNQGSLSNEGRTHLDAKRSPTEILIKTQKSLIEKLENLTKNIVRCCATLTTEEMFSKQLNQQADAEKEVLDLKRMQDESNDWIYASKVILAELTGDESLIDIPAPKRDVVVPSVKALSEWPDVSSTRRKNDDGTLPNGTVSFEAISRGGLTERRQLGKSSVEDDRASETSAKSAKIGFDALKTIGQLQQQLSESESRAADLQEKVISLDRDLLEAKQRIKILESQTRN